MSILTLILASPQPTTPDNDGPRNATQSARQFTRVFAGLLRRGWQGLDAILVGIGIERLRKPATAANFDLALATDLLTDAQSALGLTVKDTAANMTNMAHVGDVLVKANTLANASVEQFSQALTNKAGAAMRNLGIEIDEGVAALAVFADQGLKGEAAGTAYGIVLRDLTTKAIKNEDAFRKAGIAVFDSVDEFRSMPDIIHDVTGALDGMSDAQQKATLLQIGFSDKSLGFLQVLLGTSEKMARYEEQLEKASGTMQDVADKSMTDLTRQMNELSATWETFTTTIGPMLTGVLAGSQDGVSFFASSLATLVDVLHAVGMAAKATQVGLLVLQGRFGKAIEEGKELQETFLDDTPGQKFLQKLQDIEDQQKRAERERIAAAAKKKQDDVEEIERISAKTRAMQMLKEQHDEAIRKEQEANQKRADAIKESTRTDAERLAEKKAEIEKLFMKGLLDDATTQRALATIAEKSQAPTALRSQAPSTIQAVRAGSVEALRVQQANNSRSPEERTAKSNEVIAKAMVESLKVERQLLNAIGAANEFALAPAEDA